MVKIDSSLVFNGSFVLVEILMGCVGIIVMLLVWSCNLFNEIYIYCWLVVNVVIFGDYVNFNLFWIFGVEGMINF